MKNEKFTHKHAGRRNSPPPAREVATRCAAKLVEPPKERPATPHTSKDPPGCWGRGARAVGRAGNWGIPPRHSLGLIKKNKSGIPYNMACGTIANTT